MAKKRPVREAKRTAFSCVEAGDIEGLRTVAAEGGDIEAIPRREELSPLGRAVELGSLEMVRVLLDLGHNPNLGGISNPLAQAVRAGNRPLVNLLLEHGADVDGEEEEGETAFLYAAGAGDMEVASRLLAAGADIRHATREGRDALDFAAHGDNSAMLNFLLPQFPQSRQDTIRRQAHLIRERRQAAEKAARERDREAARPALEKSASDQLIRVFRNGKHDSFLQLLADGADPNEVNDEGTTLLAMLCASWSGVELVEPALEAGADPNRPSKFIPLQMAAANGAESVVRALLDHGADVHASSEDGWTALISAAGSGNIDVVQMLLDAGADPNAEDSEGRTAYRQALDRNNLDIADLLRPLTHDIEGAERPWRANKEGKSLERRLLAAAEAGDMEYVRKFLAEGVSADIADESFRTPLHRAAENGHVAVVDALIRSGAPLDVPAFCDWTPLFFAIRAGKIDAVRRLVEAGANLSAVDSDGCDTLTFAKKNGCDEIAEVLASHT
jgi:ankyrin repeat protein